jgi:hypothetical protein
MKKRIIIPALILWSIESHAQCAMCRATIENNISEGHAGFSASLNAGILYLFIMPYLLVGMIMFLWYRASKKNEKKYRIRGPHIR